MRRSGTAFLSERCGGFFWLLTLNGAWTTLGAAADPDGDDEGRERAGSQQEQLPAPRVSLLTTCSRPSSLPLPFPSFLTDWGFFFFFSRRSQLANTPDFRFPVSTSSLMDANSEHYSGALVQRRPQKGRMAALRDEPSKVRPPQVGGVFVGFSLLCLVQTPS